MNVNFPDKVWARLATIAEKRDISIADLLVETAEDALGRPSAAPTAARSEAPATSTRRAKQPLDWDEIARLNSEGNSDMAIARLMGRPKGSVANARRAMKLPANFGPGGRATNQNRSNAA